MADLAKDPEKDRLTPPEVTGLRKDPIPELKDRLTATVPMELVGVDLFTMKKDHTMTRYQFYKTFFIPN